MQVSFETESIRLKDMRKKGGKEQKRKESLSFSLRCSSAGAECVGAWRLREQTDSSLKRRF